jgi:Ricin-type beta-trefoil lectin domain
VGFTLRWRDVVAHAAVRDDRAVAKLVSARGVHSGAAVDLIGQPARLGPDRTGREDGAEMHGSRLMGGVRQALVVVGAVFGVALLSAGVASAADPVELKSRLGDWCLDGPNGNNTATMVNPCTGSKSQLWVFNSAARIESVAFPGDCVSISDPADDTPVILSPCQANANNQRWNHQSSGQVTSALGPE